MGMCNEKQCASRNGEKEKIREGNIREIRRKKSETLEEKKS